MLTELVSFEANETRAATSWMLGSRAGYCKTTEIGGDCEHGDMGSFSLPAAKTWMISTHLCLQFCAQCARCRYMSVSPAHRDCSWFYSCALDSLHQDVSGVRSGRWHRSNRTRSHQKQSTSRLAIVVAAHRGAGRVLDWLRDEVHNNHRSHRSYIYLQTDCAADGGGCAPPPSMLPCTEAQRCELTLLPNAGREARAYLLHLLRVHAEPSLPSLTFFVQEDEAGALLPLMSSLMAEEPPAPAATIAHWPTDLYFASGARTLCTGGSRYCVGVATRTPANCTIDSALGPSVARVLRLVHGAAACPWAAPHACPRRGVFAVSSHAIRSRSYEVLARLYALAVEETQEAVRAWCVDLRWPRATLNAYAMEGLWHLVFGVSADARCVRQPDEAAARRGFDGLWCTAHHHEHYYS